MSIPITELSEPFPSEAIKQRKGNFGNTLSYVDKVEPDFTPSNLALESWVHAAIEAFYRTWQDGIRMPSEEVIELFKGYWKDEKFEPTAIL